MTLEQHKQSIQKLFDKKTKNDITLFELILASHPASNTKKPTPRFKTEDKWISRNNDLCVEYKCFTCSCINTVSINLFLRRVSKARVGCPMCKNQDEEKREQHRTFMLSGPQTKISMTKLSDLTIQERFVESSKRFAEMDDEFKQRYILNHLTIDEFTRIRKNIKGIGNGKITDLTGWEYHAFYYVGNQAHFTPIIVKNDTFEKPKYITWNCEECKNDFLGRDLETQKNRTRILCNDCSLCNRTFKIRHLKLKDGRVIRWQSVPERRFIEWCEGHGIIIENGPTIQYSHNEKIRKYLVDFAIPTHKRLIEIKDNHIWHQQQINSGKFSAKNATANSWVQENGWKFDIIFPKQMAEFKAMLLKEKH